MTLAAEGGKVLFFGQIIILDIFGQIIIGKVSAMLPKRAVIDTIN